MHEDFARRRYKYNPLTGSLTNQLEKEIKNGVSIEGARYEKSHVCWLLLHGKWPPRGKVVDHIDRDRSNTRGDNLRLATTRQNCFNQRKSRADFKGVTYDGTRQKCWRAQIRIDGRKVNLGRYEVLEEAIAAYREAAIKHHGEFACYD